MKRLMSIMLALAVMGLGLAAHAAVDLQNAAEKMGWQLGSQAYTFKDGTFVTALEKTKSLGLKWIEIFPGQKFSDEPGKDFQTNDKATPEQRAMMKKALADAGIKPFSYGVVGGAKADAAFESVCAFAQEMGLQFVNCEPADLDVGAALAQVAEKHGLRIAVHNHPKPSKYWSPEVLLELVQKSGAPKVLGSCCDTGHFVRSGLDPLECMQKLGKDTIFFFHWKDLNEKPTPAAAEAAADKRGGKKAAPAAGQAQANGKKGKGKGKKGGKKAPVAMAGEAGPHDVPWGTGINDLWAESLLLKEWGWKGILGAEYEVWGPEQMANLKQSFEFQNMVAAALDDEGWTPLFTDLANAQMATPTAWTVQNGVIEPTGKKGDLWTKEKYGDFILDLEFKAPQEKTNSGVFLRCTDPRQWLNSSIEIQILQKPELNKTHNTGAIYDVKGVASNAVKAVGEWNRMTIIARNNMIYVMLNGHQVNFINLDQWTEAGKNPDGSKNKFKNAYKDMARKGVLGLQFHGDMVAFRNVKVKSLD